MDRCSDRECHVDDRTRRILVSALELAMAIFVHDCEW